MRAVWICRLLPFAVAGGARNMAADEVLLESAAAGVASLRFYGWDTATVSLGYFQPQALRRADPLLADLPYVRRPTGGMTLVHHYELTYALALPAGAPWQAAAPGSLPWLCRMHGVLAAALRQLGVAATAATCAAAPHAEALLCFRSVTPGDLLIGPAKVAGSAQRRQRGALLQHGAVLLAASPYAPALPGILELAGRRIHAGALIEATCREWESATGWRLAAADWTTAEVARADELAREKYAAAAWNDKR